MARQLHITAHASHKRETIKLNNLALRQASYSVKKKPSKPRRASLAFALQHFNPYLVGREFFIRTDHKPNLSIVKGKTKVYDILTDEILSYLPFHIEYLNGIKMFADAQQT